MFQTRELKNDQMNYWNANIAKLSCAHPFQAYQWGQVRAIDGWESTCIVVESENGFKGGMLTLIKKLPALNASIFYAPRGPVLDYKEAGVMEALLNSAKELAKQHNAIFLRIEPNLPESFGNQGDLFVKKGFNHLAQRWTFWSSPRDVYRINLVDKKDEKQLFNSLERDARRCVRKAKKEGVSIEPATSKYELRQFYGIFREFTIQKGFMVRAFEYQEKLWDEFISKGMGRLFLARYNGEIIGGLICIMFANKCVAMHMGTPYRYQRLQTYYAYVWESIKWAKENGCEWYSFRGAGSTPTQERFKRKFGPQVVRLAGYYDYVFKPFLYKAFYFSEFTAIPIIWPFAMRVRRRLGKLGDRACSYAKTLLSQTP